MEDLWAALREVFDESRAVEDAACAAALSGPIRFHLNARHGSNMLLPHLGKLKSLAQPLRYRLTEDGHFVLYSVGMDCADNGGEMRRPRRRELDYQGSPDFGAGQQGPDLVWPRPASEAEVQAQKEGEARQAELARAAAQERRAEAQRQAEAERQATVEKLLAEAEASRTAPQASREESKEPTYKGRPLSQLLRNERTAGTNRFTLDELLTVRQVVTGEELGAVTFEVPVSYDAVTNLGRIHLLVDGEMDAASLGEPEDRQTC